MAVIYEWDAEIQVATADGEVLEIAHNHHSTAKAMLKTMAEQPTCGKYCPAVVRDVFNRYGELTERSWAYLVKGESGKWILPEAFHDALDHYVCMVGKRLHRELAKAQGDFK